MRDLRVLTWLPVGAMAALAALSLVAPGFLARVALPIAVGGALVGLPHGAVDHLATPRSRRSFATAYALVALVALVVFLLEPTPTLVVFLLLSGLHFGSGEVVCAAERAGRAGTRGCGSVRVAWGAAVVGLLLWSHAGAVDPYLRPLSPWVADAVLAHRAVGLPLVVGALALGLAVELRDGRRLEAAELALVAGTFVLAPPLAAFGVYFGLWHAVRHTGRLLDLSRAPDDESWRAAARLLTRASLAPTLVAGCAIAVLMWTRGLGGLQSELGVLLALTFPHAATVWALDRRGPSSARVSDRDTG